MDTRLRPLLLLLLVDCADDSFTTVPTTDDAAVRTDAEAGAPAAEASSDATGPDTAPPPPTMTVTGSVLFAFLERPVKGATVSVGANMTTTDAMGAFTLTSVVSPYDLTAAYVDGSGIRHTRIYEHLTIAKPCLKYTTVSPEPLYTATITGTVKPTGALPFASGHTVRVWTSGSKTATADLATGAFTLSPVWQGSPSTSVSVYAYEVALDGLGMPGAYYGYGKLTVSVSNGGATVGSNIPLASEASVYSSVTYTPSVPLAPASVSMFYDFDRPVTVGSFGGGAPGANVSIATPKSSATTHVILGGLYYLSSVYVGGSYVAPSGGAANPEAPLTNVSPATMTTLSPATVFSWDAKSMGPYELTFNSKASGQNEEVVSIVTQRNSLTLPAGATLPSGIVTATVYHYLDSPSVDDRAARFPDGQDVSWIVRQYTAP